MIAKNFVFVLIIASLLLSSNLSLGNMGYNIGLNSSGNLLIIDRDNSKNLTLKLSESISGSGNFSRYSHIRASSDMEYQDRSSAVRGGDFSVEGATTLINRIGPVKIKYELFSLNGSTGENQSELNEYAKADIDEIWPYFFINNKTVIYAGKGIRTNEIYNSNEDIISIFANSWKLQETSLYSSYNNRTLISARVTPSKTLVDRKLNKTTDYILNFKSAGALAGIDVKRIQPYDEKIYHGDDEIISHISQEYTGIVEMSLRIAAKNALKIPCIECNSLDQLPCCSLIQEDSQYASKNIPDSNCIFNCSSKYYSTEGRI